VHGDRKRILITGGTGFFGKSILDYFARHANDYELTVLSRHGLRTTNSTHLTNFPTGDADPNSCNFAMAI